MQFCLAKMSNRMGPVHVLLLVLTIINSPGVFSAGFPNWRLGRSFEQHLSGESIDYKKDDVEKQEFFEVTKPVDLPQGAHKVCSQILLQHVFGNTINEPPTLAQYQPPQDCISEDWTAIVLRWEATSRGRQFDRISAVWLGGVEVFRTCTAEPTAQGIEWSVEKDVTPFASVFKAPQLLAVMLANVVNEKYTGLFNVTLSAHYYSVGEAEHSRESYGGVADLILPFAESSPLNGGHWFQLQNESDLRTQEIKIPRNAYKAVLEVCVSPHGSDEFWYTNPPDDYLNANNLTEEIPGNGTFREVLVSIDGLLAAMVNPFPVLYTGGVNPYFWRPISAIGSFALPSYNVEVTSFLGKLVDDQNHTFSITVTNAIPYWLVSANLHLWLDHSTNATTGELFEHSAPALTSHIMSKFEGLNGTFHNKASRELSYKGYLKSSFGNLTTTTSYISHFSNYLKYTDDGLCSTINQNSKMDSTVIVKAEARDLVYEHRSYAFPLQLFYDQIEYPNKTTFVEAGIRHGWRGEQERQSSIGSGQSSFSRLDNKQHSKGQMFIPTEGGVIGFASTEQWYAYHGTDGCYWRYVGASNYTFLYDDSGTLCTSLLS